MPFIANNDQAHVYNPNGNPLLGNNQQGTNQDNSPISEQNTSQPNSRQLLSSNFPDQHPYNQNNPTLGNQPVTLQDVKQSYYDINKIYVPNEIFRFRLNEAIQNHPYNKKPPYMRSKLAYRDILSSLQPTNKYLLPGQLVVFEYLEPKYKEELKYYDKTPFTLFIGITRLPDGNIREIGINLHYFPPYTRMRVLNKVYALFKPYFDKYFNEAPQKPNLYINWNALKYMMKVSDKIGFGIKMYIPSLRSKTFVLPTKAVPTAFYTEGNFSKATLSQIMSFWRQFQV